MVLGGGEAGDPGGAWAGFTQEGVQEETQSCKRQRSNCSDTWRSGECAG